MKKIIVVPDVHGRTFWKDIKDVTDTPIVFLGDYLDPYSHEGITERESLDNFNEILEFAKTHPNVHLLIGNHDCGYMFDREICNCRTLTNYHTARHMFLDNKDLFKLAYRYQNILFTHAGVDSRWLTELIRRGYITLTDDIADDINKILELPEGKIIKSLGMVSRLRGGLTNYGSCVWSDINDFSSMKDSLGYKQIVGHTMQLKKRNIQGHWIWDKGDPKIDHTHDIFCIDCQRAFYIDEYNDVFEYNSDKKIV